MLLFGIEIENYIPSCIFLLLGLISGYVFKMLILSSLLKISARTKWKGDDIIIGAIKNVIVLFFFLAGLYLAVLSFPDIEFFNRLVVMMVIKVVFILLLTIVLARILVGFISVYQQNSTGLLHKTSILQYVTRTVIYIFGGLYILQTMGISITPMLTALGVGGLAVALALQDTLSNLFAGLQILAAKNIQPGDFIKLESGDEGFVVDINWRSTTIRALPNRIIIIPNSKLATSIVNNFSKPDKEIAVLVDVGVSYTSDLEKVEKTTIEVASEIMKTVNGGVTEFEPFIRYNKFDAYSINFTVIMRAREFTDQYLIRHEFMKKLHKQYISEGIEIPFPITTVYMKQP